jgi:hypothetical protein
LSAEPDRDSPMTATYVGVLAVEVIIFVLLWAFARAFS